MIGKTRCPKINKTSHGSKKSDDDPLIPTKYNDLLLDPSIVNPYELRKQWITTIAHCQHVEYYAHILGIGNEDPQRPHDIVGIGNRLNYMVLGPLSLQHRFPEVDQRLILLARDFHRENQVHHQRYNGPDLIDLTKPCKSATDDSMMLGSLDAYCAISENRRYNIKEIGFITNYDEVESVLLKDPPHKLPFHRKLIPIIRTIERPDFSRIINPYNFPNLGLPIDTFNAIQDISKQAMKELKEKYGIVIPKN